MKWAYLVLFSLAACTHAVAKPSAEIPVQPKKLNLVPFTQDTDYMSVFGFLRHHYFGASSAQQAVTSSTDLKGTNWSGIDIYMSSRFVPYTYRFGPNAVLTYGYQGQTYSNGTWRQNGDAVYMETNHKYSERVGLIQGKEILGVGRNVVGQTWNWSANR